MRALKQTLDPAGLLNPGKVLLDEAAGGQPAAAPAQLAST
jgi:hypothetical protein